MLDSWLKLKSGSDIRGLAEPSEGREALLTEERAQRIAYAFALNLAKELGTTTDRLKISVGRDERPSSEALSRAAIRGLTAADADVLDCGNCTTPAMHLTTLSPGFDCDGAMMVTGSHHPAQMNGFKLISRGGSLGGEAIEQILLAARAIVPPRRLVTEVNFLESYRERLGFTVRELLETDEKCPLVGLYLVVDAGNIGGRFFAACLKELGADVEDALVPPDAAPRDPEDPKAVEKLSRAVLGCGADLGLAFDADGDRALIVDEKGRPVNRNRLIALISAILLDADPGATIVTDSVTSTGLQKFITEWGGVHYRFKRGYKNVIDEAVRLNGEGIDCPLAIETSGHAAFRDNHFLDDGMYLATRLLCEALKRKKQGLTLLSLIEEMPEPVESAAVRLEIRAQDARQAAQRAIERVLSHTLDNPEWRLATDNREGVRILFDLDGGVGNAWFQMRLSVHDPVMPVNFESDAPGGVRRMAGQLYALLRDEAGDLNLDPLKELTSLQS